MTATSDSPRAKWTFAICLPISVVLAIASFRLLPNPNLPIGLTAIAAILSLVELICEIQEKRIRLATSRALMVKAIRIFLTLTPLLLLHILAPYAIASKPAASRQSRVAMSVNGGKSDRASEARIHKLETTDLMLKRRLSALEKRR